MRINNIFLVFRHVVREKEKYGKCTIFSFKSFKRISESNIFDCYKRSDRMTVLYNVKLGARHRDIISHITK